MDPVKIEPRCPQCGAKLRLQSSGVEPNPDDRAICPVHGDVGSVEEIARAALDQNLDEISKNIADHLRDVLRKCGV